jgi:cyanate lyase
MQFKTTEQLAEYTRTRWKKSGLTLKKIAQEIGKNETLVSKAVQKSEKNNTARNGIRREILQFLGFEVDIIFSVKRQKKT